MCHQGPRLVEQHRGSVGVWGCGVRRQGLIHMAALTVAIQLAEGLRVAAAVGVAEADIEEEGSGRPDVTQKGACSQPDCCGVARLIIVLHDALYGTRRLARGEGIDLSVCNRRHPVCYCIKYNKPLA